MFTSLSKTCQWPDCCHLKSTLALHKRCFLDRALLCLSSLTLCPIISQCLVAWKKLPLFDSLLGFACALPLLAPSLPTPNQLLANFFRRLRSHLSGWVEELSPYRRCLSECTVITPSLGRLPPGNGKLLARSSCVFHHLPRIQDLASALSFNGWIHKPYLTFMKTFFFTTVD